MEGFILGATLFKLPYIGKPVGRSPQKAHKPAKILNPSNLRELFENIRLEKQEKQKVENKKAQKLV